MENTLPGDDCFREVTKGNVRVRMHEVLGKGAKMYVVEVSAYSLFSTDWKILSLQGTFDLQTANRLFEKLTSRIRGYSWMDEDFIRDDQ